MCIIVIVDKLIGGRTMAKKTNKTKNGKRFSLVPKLKKKSTNKKVLMAIESFLSTLKSNIIYDPKIVALIKKMTEEQCRQIRTVFNQINKSGGVATSDEEVMDLFGINRTEARNVLKSAEAIYKSQKELVSGQYLPDTKRDIKSLKESVKRNTEKLVKATKKGNIKRVKRLKKLLIHLKNKLNKKQQRLEKIENSLDAGKFSVCFGRKKLIRQFSNNLSIFKDEKVDVAERIEAYKNYEQQKNEWVARRSDEYFAEGHSVQKSGNSRAQILESGNEFELKINVPKSLQKEFGSSVTVGGITYGDRRNQEIREAVRNVGDEKRNKTEYPVTQRLKLVRDRNGVGVQVISSIHIRKHEIISDRRNGAMGVDFNQHSLDWAIVDYYGNPVRAGKIPDCTQDRNSEQTKDAVSKAVSQLFEIAIHYRVPLYFEDLAFKNNSERLKSRGKKFSRMASNLPFAIFRELVQQKSYRTGIAVKFVNPAFTSIIGMYKYMPKYGLSSGTAAGMVIARRGLGFKETIPSFIVNSGIFPEDNKPDVNSSNWHDWGRLSKARRSSGKRDRHQIFSLVQSGAVNCRSEENHPELVVTDSDSSRRERTDGYCHHSSELDSKSPCVTGAPVVSSQVRLSKLSNDAQL